MPFNTYKLRRIYSSQAPGSTRPSRCAVSGILKFDDIESPHSVFNEYVSSSLGKIFQIPIADGGLTMTGDGHAFVSMEIGSPGLPLPDATPSRRRRIAEQYPDEVAALLAFDILIGNSDRGDSIKVALETPHIRLFAGYDHSHALLNIEEDPHRSIERLADDQDLILQFHPFYRLVQPQHLHEWLVNIGRVPDERVSACCLYSRPFRGVTEDMQTALANALIRRKNSLWDIVDREESTIYG